MSLHPEHQAIRHDKAIVRPHKETTGASVPVIQLDTIVRPYTEQTYQEERDAMIIRCAPLEMDLREAEQQFSAARVQTQTLTSQTLDLVSIQRQREMLAEIQTRLQSSDAGKFYPANNFKGALALGLKRVGCAIRGVELPELVQTQEQETQLRKINPQKSLSPQIQAARAQESKAEESLKHVRGRLRLVMDTWAFASDDNFGNRVFYYIIENARNLNRLPDRIEELVGIYQTHVEGEFHLGEVMQYIQWCVRTGLKEYNNPQAVTEFLSRLLPGRSNEEYETLRHNIYQIEDPAALAEYFKDDLSQIASAIYDKGGRQIRKNLAAHAAENLKDRLRTKGVNDLEGQNIAPYFAETADLGITTERDIVEIKDTEVRTDTFRGFSTIKGEEVEITPENLRDIIISLLDDQNVKGNQRLVDDIYISLVQLYRTLIPGVNHPLLEKLKRDIRKKTGATYRVRSGRLLSDHYRPLINYNRDQSGNLIVELVSVPQRPDAYRQR